ncbi:MAG: heme ABC exporter ATP-binding protein CcmA [Alphaproteobacteria bacterium]|nr:heme ABC exporter ATP-binding protein CcmA [Alphaproteobacteria bacterium]
MMDASSIFAGEGLACLRGERLVFARLDFQVEAGEALVLVGPNGSGKSSLLRLMAGLLAPMDGRLVWNGAPVADDREAHAARCHYVGHHDAIKPVLTVRENLAFWARLHSDDHRAEVAVAEALDAFGLIHLADLPGKLLSAGQKRRLNLGRLLAAPAPLWLLDEPITALDRASIKGLEAVMASHLAHGGMVILSTHADIDLPTARLLALDGFKPRPVALEAW